MSSWHALFLGLKKCTFVVCQLVRPKAVAGHSGWPKKTLEETRTRFENDVNARIIAPAYVPLRRHELGWGGPQHEPEEQELTQAG